MIPDILVFLATQSAIYLGVEAITLPHFAVYEGEING